jgi:uncharacterized membrane protein
MKTSEKTFISDLSGKEYPLAERTSVSSIRSSLKEFIRKEHPNIDDRSYISFEDLSYYRERYISEYVTGQMGELTELEKKVLDSITNNTLLSEYKEDEEKTVITFGQRVADRVATFGGSWTFIISFGIFLALWISANVVILTNRAFDPYPFILLNLILSCIAAMQAPVIMMSQNRQEEKDRERAKKDYMINLKAELEIRNLNERIDHLITHQQQELIELQKIQIEMMDDIMKRLEQK